MANANLEKVDLIEVVPFQNGERANADNLNRPIIQLRDNITNQKGVLDSVIDMLSSNNTSLDDLQEVADFIESNKEELRDLTALMNDGGKLRLDNRLGQTDVEKVTYDADGDLDTIKYKSINFYDTVTNTVTPSVFDVRHTYNDDKLLTKVEYIDVRDENSTETLDVITDKITVQNKIKEVTSIIFKEEIYGGGTAIDGSTITLDDDSNDGILSECTYKYDDADGNEQTTTENVTVSGTDISVSNTVKEVVEIRLEKDTTYEGSTTISDKEVTLDDNSHDTIKTEIQYVYVQETLKAKNEFTYVNDNIDSVQWSVV